VQDKAIISIRAQTKLSDFSART